MKPIKYSQFAGLLVLAFLLNSCGVYRQAREFERFVQGQFSINSARVQSIAGVGLSNVRKLSDLNFNDILKLSQGLLAGDLSSKVLLNIEVRNLSDQKASVSGMDWVLLQNHKIIASGQLNRPVQVSAHGKTSFPIQATFNLLTILKLNSINQILDLLAGKPAQEELQKLKLTLRLKPYYKLGNKIKKYPGYLSIRPVFSKK